VKILLDEHLPTKLRHDLPGHEVCTVEFLAWKGTKNGALLLKAVAAGFDALVTGDRTLPYETRVPVELRVVIVEPPRLRLADVRPLMPAVARALAEMRPGEVRRIKGA
jgi:hypothetical protein